MSDWPFRVMVYGAGEAISGTGALAPQIQAQLARLVRISTNPYVAAIAQLDSSSVPAQRYVLDPRGQQPIYQFPNVNVGDPSELVNFVSWSVAVCPARRSVLVLSGHGAAWEDGMVDQILGTPGTTARRSLTAVPQMPGAIHHARSLFGNNVSSDDSIRRAVLIDGHNRDYLSNAELGAACARISSMLGGKIDVLVFDACLMSAWEILQELSDSVSTVVASIDELSAAGIDLARPAYDLTVAHGVGDAGTVAATIARQFTPQTSFDSCVAIDLTNPNWVASISAFRAFCVAFLPWVQASPSNAAAALGALRFAATSVVQFSSGGLADVGALANAIGNIPNAPANALGNIRSAAASLATCVLGRSAGRDYQSSMGLSIFSPNSATVYNANRPEYVRLQFPNRTGWSAILDALYGFQSDQTRFLTGASAQPPVAAGASSDDTEFVVSLRGFPIDNPTRDRIEKVIRRTVLEKLAEVDALGDVTVTPTSTVLNARRIGLPEGTMGLVVDRLINTFQ
jgi:hypothetical protein